jgi:hypothetical protein
MADETNPTEPDETSGQAAQEAATEHPPPTEAAEQPAPNAEQPAPAAEQPAPAEPPAAETPAAEPPAPAAEQPAPAAEQPAPAEPPAAEPPAPAAEQPAPAAEQAASEEAAPSMPEPPPAEAAAPAAEQTASEGPAPAPAGARGAERPRGKKPRRDRPRRDRAPGQGQGRDRPRRDRPPRQPQQRASGPLPFQELRDAATSVIDLFGARQALRDAFAALGEKERRDLARLVADDGDWRVRARNIAAGSLGAGRVGKALAAQQISMARVEDLWTLTLSKEEAAERQARIRNARRRDERRAQRDAERDQRSDRVSRADLEKAQDGRVGAQIRIVIGGTSSNDRRRKEEDDDKTGRKQGSDLLDRLGY